MSFISIIEKNDLTFSILQYSVFNTASKKQGALIRYRYIVAWGQKIITGLFTFIVK